MHSHNAYKYLLSIVLLSILIPKALSCGYRVPAFAELVTGITIAPLPVGYQPRSVSANGLRIFYEYTDSFINYAGASDIKTYILEPARLSLQSLLTVNNPVNGLLRVDRQCISNQYLPNNNKEVGCTTGCVATTTCAGVIIPDKYLNKCKVMSAGGVLSYTGTDGSGEPNVDFVLIVTANPCSPGIFATANSCFQEIQLDRPILGVLNICPNMIVANKNNNVNIIIIKHQIIHALGFGVDKFAFFRNVDGTPFVPRDNLGRPTLGKNDNGYYNWNEKIISPVNRSRTSVSTNTIKPFLALVLPSIVTVAQEHFNCPSIQSVELEDTGPIQSALSHFDEYLLYNEYMTSEYNGWNQRLSKFTLALLKDSGWYGVDYTKADIMDYGKGVGCVLPLYGCYSHMQSQRNSNSPIDPFCDIANGQILQCDPSRQYFQYCNIIRYSGLAPIYQYFSSLRGNLATSASYYAGSSEYSEYCPMKSVPLSDNFSTNCTDANNNGKSNIYTPITSSYGPNSTCFDTTLKGQPIFGATCLTYFYNGNYVNYGLCIDSQGVVCTNNAVQSFNTSSGIQGTISCVNPSMLKLSNPDQSCIYPAGFIKGGNNLMIKTWIMIWIIVFRVLIQLN